MVNYYTLSVSIFVLMMMGMFTISDYFVQDMTNLESGVDQTNKTGNKLNSINADPSWAIDKRDNLNSNHSSIEALNMFDRPATEQEKQGAQYTQLTMAQIMYKVFVNSSVGLADFFAGQFGINGGTAMYLLQFIQFGVIMNHALLLLQVLFDRLGGT